MYWSNVSFFLNEKNKLHYTPPDKTIRRNRAGVQRAALMACYIKDNSTSKKHHAKNYSTIACLWTSLAWSTKGNLECTDQLLINRKYGKATEAYKLCDSTAVKRSIQSLRLCGAIWLLEANGVVTDLIRYLTGILQGDGIYDRTPRKQSH